MLDKHALRHIQISSYFGLYDFQIECETHLDSHIYASRTNPIVPLNLSMFFR